MADMKISDLPVAPNVNDAQQFEVNDGGNSRRVTFQQLRDKIKAEFGKPIYPAINPTSWDDLPETYPGTGLVPVLVRKNLADAADNNGPLGHAGHHYYVQQFFYNDARVTQLAIPYTTAKIAFRSRDQNGTWAAWRQVLDNTSTITAAKISDATAVGRNVLKAASQAAARSAIGAGTGNSNLTLGTTATTAKAGNWKPHIDTDTEGQLPYSRLTDVPEAGGGANYGAGDTYVVGRLRNFATTSHSGLPGDNPQSLAGEVLAASDGTIRIRATHRGDLRIRLDGTQVAYWGSPSGNSDRTLDLPVTRGQVITVEVSISGVYSKPYVNNVRFLSATIAPFVIPLPAYPAYINPPSLSWPGDPGGPD